MSAEAIADLGARLDRFVADRKWLRLTLDGPDTLAELMEMPGEREARDRWEREQWRKAVWMLLSTKLGDYEDARWWCRWPIKAACLLALILGRRGQVGFRGSDMGHWDLVHGFGAPGSWSCMVLNYDRRQFVYSIDCDGE